MTVLVFRVWRGWKKKLKRRRRPVWLLGAALGPVFLAVFASGVSTAAAAPVTPPAGAAWIGALFVDSGAPGGIGVPSFALSPALAVEAFAPAVDRSESPSIVSGENGFSFPYEELSLHGAFFQLPVEALESSSHAGPGSRLASCAPVPFP
jgi:hypothetical protein